VRTGTDGANPGVAGMLTVGSSAGIGLPNIGNIFSVSGSVSVMFNTTRQDQVFQIPTTSCRCCIRGTRPRSPSSPPRRASTGSATCPRRPAGEIYVSATIQAQLTFGGVITLNGFIQIQAGVDPGSGSAYLRVIGAVGGQIPFLGSVTGQLSLSIFLGGRSWYRRTHLADARLPIRSRASISKASSCSKLTRSRPTGRFRHSR